MPAGYSGTPLPKKLGIAEGSRVHLARAPAGFEAALGPLPAGAKLVGPSAREPDVTLLFARRLGELERAFPRRAGRLQPGAALWVAWPKKASGLATELSFDAVQAVGLAAGLVDTKICAVDETWSGLKFMVRRSGSRTGRPARKP
jgi:hypothetical protein